jgi:hypothetical protein
MKNQFEEPLALAFRDVFAANAPYFGGGGPEYYGVDVENVSADGTSLDLVLVFRSGVRYCCFEFICHFSYRLPSTWARLRECMNQRGLAHLSLPVIERVRGVVEAGAVAVPSYETPEFPMEGSVYHKVGPFPPVYQSND